MPRLLYRIDLTVPPLELAAQSLSIVRVQEYARKQDLTVDEREGAYSREYVITIPPDRLNDVLWDLDTAGLLKLSQGITGDPALHVKLEQRFSWLDWVDDRLTSAVQEARHDLAQVQHEVTTGIYRILLGLHRFASPVPFNLNPAAFELAHENPDSRPRQ